MMRIRLPPAGLLTPLIFAAVAACSRSSHEMAVSPDPDGGHAAHVDTTAHHAGHGGMDMGMDIEVTIPAGAIYTAADVHFMQGMIAHHAQAIAMSRLADTFAVDPQLVRFARKIDQSQAAEILLMQAWLADRDQFVPDTMSHHTMHMVGMLTPEEMAELAAARGATFDRRFLELMIKHHEGALTMVADLFDSPRAGQEVDVNVFANEVQLVQTIEIGLMHQMLEDLKGAP